MSGVGTSRKLWIYTGRQAKSLKYGYVCWYLQHLGIHHLAAAVKSYEKDEILNLISAYSLLESRYLKHSHPPLQVPDNTQSSQSSLQQGIRFSARQQHSTPHQVPPSPPKVDLSSAPQTMPPRPRATNNAILLTFEICILCFVYHWLIWPWYYRILLIGKLPFVSLSLDCAKKNLAASMGDLFVVRDIARGV